MDVSDGHLEIWIDPTSEPIAGRLTQGGEEQWPFAGWMELTAAIEATRCGRDLGGGALPGIVLAS